MYPRVTAHNTRPLWAPGPGGPARCGPAAAACRRSRSGGRAGRDASTRPQLDSRRPRWEAPRPAPSDEYAPFFARGVWGDGWRLCCRRSRLSASRIGVTLLGRVDYLGMPGRPWALQAWGMLRTLWTAQPTSWAMGWGAGQGHSPAESAPGGRGRPLRHGAQLPTVYAPQRLMFE